MYNENIYLVTFASLHPEQLFSSSKHSSFLPGKEKRAARSFWSCQQERELEPDFQSCLCLSPPLGSRGSSTTVVGKEKMMLRGRPTRESCLTTAGRAFEVQSSSSKAGGRKENLLKLTPCFCSMRLYVTRQG